MLKARQRMSGDPAHPARLVAGRRADRQRSRRRRSWRRAWKSRSAAAATPRCSASALLQLAWDHVVLGASTHRESAFELHANGGVPAWRGRLRRSFDRYNELANARPAAARACRCPRSTCDSIRNAPLVAAAGQSDRPARYRRKVPSPGVGWTLFEGSIRATGSFRSKERWISR